MESLMFAFFFRIKFIIKIINVLSIFKVVRCPAPKNVFKNCLEGVTTR
mgnify:FL=1